MFKSSWSLLPTFYLFPFLILVSFFRSQSVSLSAFCCWICNNIPTVRPSSFCTTCSIISVRVRGCPRQWALGDSDASPSGGCRYVTIVFLSLSLSSLFVPLFSQKEIKSSSRHGQVQPMPCAALYGFTPRPWLLTCESQRTSA